MPTRVATPLDLSTDRAGRLILVQHSNTRLRVVSLPFLGLGGYLVWQVVAGALQRDLTVAGAIALPILALAFLVPGWILLAGRRRTAIDPALRLVVREIDFRLFSRRQVEPVPVGAHVDVVLETRRIDRGEGTGGSSDDAEPQRRHTFAVIEIAAPGSTPILLAVLDGAEEGRGREIARQAAVLLGLPVSSGTRGED